MYVIKKPLFQSTEIMSLRNINSLIPFFVDLLKYTYSCCLKVMDIEFTNTKYQDKEIFGAFNGKKTL